VVDNVVVVDEVVVDTIDDHVRFSTYHRLDFDHQSWETSLWWCCLSF